MQDNITDWALEQYHQIYHDKKITKEDIFYYVYGILHHPEFRKKYKAFLVKGIPSVPFARDFWAYSKAGRELGNLHLNFETCPRYDLGEPANPIPSAPKRIAFDRKPNDGPGPRTKDDPTKLKLDGTLVYDNLPNTTYKVNGHTPVGWFVNRYGYKKDNTTEIENYPLEGKSPKEVRAIIERLVYVGVESDRIIRNLPEEFEMEVGLKQVPQTTLTGENQTRLM